MDVIKEYIYVVRGRRGEYSERYDWPVIAFKDKSKAEELVVLATQEARRLEQLQEKYLELSKNRSSLNMSEKLKFNKYDPSHKMTYMDDTGYFYERVGVLEAVAQLAEALDLKSK